MLFRFFSFIDLYSPIWRIFHLFQPWNTHAVQHLPRKHEEAILVVCVSLWGLFCVKNKQHAEWIQTQRDSASTKPSVTTMRDVCVCACAQVCACRCCLITVKWEQLCYQTAEDDQQAKDTHTHTNTRTNWCFRAVLSAKWFQMEVHKRSSWQRWKGYLKLRESDRQWSNEYSAINIQWRYIKHEPSNRVATGY